MYLFSRTIRLAPGDMRQQMHWAEMITEKVNQISEVRVSLWAPFASPQTSSLAWSAAVPNMSTLETISDKLMADPTYHDLVAEGARFGTEHGVQDLLVNLWHEDRPSDLNKTQYVALARSTSIPGQTAQAAKIGVDIAKTIKTVTGRPTSFGACVTGSMDTFQWYTYCDSIEQFDKGMTKLYEDNDFMRLTDVEASKVFAPGGEMILVRRLL